MRTHIVDLAKVAAAKSVYNLRPSVQLTWVLLICGLDGRSIISKSLFSFIVWLDVLKNI